MQIVLDVKSEGEQDDREPGIQHLLRFLATDTSYQLLRINGRENSFFR